MTNTPPYDEGYNAFHANVPRDHNPYNKVLPQHCEEWFRGWDFAEKVEKEANRWTG